VTACHQPAAWPHTCIADTAAAHLAPLCAALYNSLFQVVRPIVCAYTLATNETAPQCMYWVSNMLALHACSCCSAIHRVMAGFGEAFQHLQLTNPDKTARSGGDHCLLSRFQVVTGDVDGTIIMWDAHTGERQVQASRFCSAEANLSHPGWHCEWMS